MLLMIREMQFNVAMKSYVLSIRLRNMKKFDNTSCWWMCRLENLCGGQFGNKYKNYKCPDNLMQPFNF